MTSFARMSHACLTNERARTKNDDCWHDAMRSRKNILTAAEMNDFFLFDCIFSRESGVAIAASSAAQLFIHVGNAIAGGDVRKLRFLPRLFIPNKRTFCLAFRSIMASRSRWCALIVDALVSRLKSLSDPSIRFSSPDFKSGMQ